MKNKLWVLLKREYNATVRRKAFVIGTFLTPLLFAMIFLLPIYWKKWNSKTYQLAILDRTDSFYELLEPALSEVETENGKPKYSVSRLEDSEEALAAARQRVEDKKLHGILILPEDVLEVGEAELHMRSLTQFEVQREIRSIVGDEVREIRLKRTGLTAQIIGSILQPISLAVESVTDGKKNAVQQFMIAVMTVFLLYLTLVLYGSQIMMAVIEDKTSRVYEVVLSSASPRQILLGKVLGVGMAAVTQYAVWGLAFFWLKSSFPIPQLENLEFEPALLFQLVPLFVLGFLVYSQIYGALGSLCRSSQDAQQIQWPVLIFLMLPMFLIEPLTSDPDGMASVAMSLFPMTSSIVMPLRIGVTTPELWQMVTCYGLLAATGIAAYFVSGKVFQTAIMIHGKRPAWRQVARWITQPAAQ